MAEARYYGIRHHGAGSARNLLNALDRFDPEVLLIEGPQDCQHLIQHIDGKSLTPPVAMMVYSKSDHEKYAYYPFTLFSPEWQALMWAHERSRAVYFIDLPHGRSISLREKFVKENEGTGLIRDPFSHLAQLAGYTDSEAWWDDYIEQSHDPDTVFQIITDLMIQLRKSSSYEHHSNRVREAFMRTEIRSVQKGDLERIAIICGAWHIPALIDHTQFKVGDDLRLWKSAKLDRTSAAWVPWSYQRIAKHSGYGSGVVSPFWYEALFEDPEKAIARWMSRAAAEMRTLGWQASSAEAIEAGRLVTSLTALRAKNRPGIAELFDSMATVFCRGNQELLDKLTHTLLAGDRVGTVAESVGMVPLQRDIEANIRSCRLSKAWESHEILEKHLDIRKPNQLRISQLLHRLSLLGIPWGFEGEPESAPLSQFHEYWTLAWYPDFQIRIIEASLYGHTIIDACSGYLREQIRGKDRSFQIMTDLLMRVLKADLPNLIPTMCQAISDQAATNDDINELLQTAPKLILAMHYGNTRKLDVRALQQVTHQLLPRIILALPQQTQNISDEVAEDLANWITDLDQALRLANISAISPNWIGVQHKLIDSPRGHGLIKGVGLRILFDRQELSEESTAAILSFELSNDGDPMYALHFLQSFLRGGGSLLIHYRSLRNALDAWLIQVEEEYFMDYLAILRRIFSGFSKGEKENLFALLTNPDTQTVLNSKPSLEQIRKKILEESVASFYDE